MLQVTQLIIENIHIRHATKDDAAGLSKVIAAVIRNIPYYNSLAKQNEIDKFQPEALKEKIVDDPYSVILATIENEIAGFCLSRFDDFTIWLEWFGIAAHHRGKGIAHKLLLQLDQTVHIRKCHKIWCDCRTANEASIHLLESNGYRKLVTLTNHWYGQDFILWEKLV